VEPGGVSVAGKGMADEDRVGLLGVQFTVGLIGDFDLGEGGAGSENQRAIA